MCFFSDTRQTRSLPCAGEDARGKVEAHDKPNNFWVPEAKHATEYFCRVPHTQHMANISNVHNTGDGHEAESRPLGFAM